MRTVIYFLFGLYFYLVERIESLNCSKQLSPCSCEIDFGTVIINLSPLDAGGKWEHKFNSTDNSTGTPRIFKYNPCSEFVCDYHSIASVCYYFSPTEEEILGIQSSARFVGTTDNFSIIIR